MYVRVKKILNSQIMNRENFLYYRKNTEFPKNCIFSEKQIENFSKKKYTENSLTRNQE